MASVEFNGYKITFKNGLCRCANGDLQTMGQGLIDRFPSYYGNPHNYAIQEFLDMGGKNPVLEVEPEEVGPVKH